MKPTNMTKIENVEKQYVDDSKLNIRKKLHKVYSVNKQGFGKWLFSQYDIKSGDRILELGSGNGDLWAASIETLSKEVDLYLSDFSSGMVDIIKEKYSSFNVNVKVIDIQDIPFDDSSFDIVIANMMLYHVPNLEKGLKEVSRVLKPDGVFYSATFGEEGLSQYINDVLYNLEFIDKETTSYSFTLQKGNSVLKPYFANISCVEYIDRLEISDATDLVGYIKTMAVMSGVKMFDEAKLLKYLETRKDKNGLIIIPKEYGTFISKNKK